MINRKSGFTTVTNDIVRNNKLSAKAKGIYLYLQSNRDDWQFYINEIVSNFSDGKRAILNGIKELQENKLLIKTQIKGTGKFEPCLWILNPTNEDIALYCEVSTVTTKCVNAFSDNAKCVDAKRTTNNTNNNNTKKNNTNSNVKREDFKSFRDRIINTSSYKDGFQLENCKPFKQNATFKLNSRGLIVNLTNDKLLTKEDSFIVWEYLYERLSDENLFKEE